MDGSLGVDDNRLILAIDGDDLGRVLGGAVKLRASQVHPSRGLDPALEVKKREVS